jgi:subtilisin family serine protease
VLRGISHRARASAACCAALAIGAGAAVAGAGPASADQVRNAQMWVLDAISASAAWQVTRGQGVVVAVIDSGVDPDVSDLTGSVLTGPDLTGVKTPSTNAGWGVHGTWMASLIAGHGHDGGSSGIIGVAPASKVLSIRVVTDRADPGYGQYQQESDSRVQQSLATAISYATAHGASVISMSLGYGSPSAVVRSALQDALDRGVVVVASSGNSGDSVGARSGQAPYSFPADYPGVLGVAAVSQSGSTANFSSDNLSVQVGAPGVDVPAQGRDGQYWLVSGTSPACALTAGVAALIKAVYPRLAPALVVRAITSSAQNRPAGGYDDKVGFGTVDAAAALTAAAALATQGARPAAAATTYFGGGSAAVAAPPVRPRSAAGLALSCLLGLASLTVVGTAWTRLIAARRARHRAGRMPVAAQHAAAWPVGHRPGPAPVLPRPATEPAVPGPDSPLAHTEPGAHHQMAVGWAVSPGDHDEHWRGRIAPPASWPADAADRGLDQPWPDAAQ